MHRSWTAVTARLAAAKQSGDGRGAPLFDSGQSFQSLGASLPAVHRNLVAAPTHCAHYGNQTLPLASTNWERVFICGTHSRCQFKFQSSGRLTRLSDRSVKLMLMVTLWRSRQNRDISFSMPKPDLKIPFLRSPATADECGKSDSKRCRSAGRRNQEHPHQRCWSRWGASSPGRSKLPRPQNTQPVR